MYYFAYGAISVEQKQRLLMTRGLQLVADEAWAQGNLYDTGFGFPAMAPGDGTTHGKLFFVEMDALQTLVTIAAGFDELNPPYRFALTPISANTRRGAYDAQAFMYDSGEGLESIPGGIWK